MRATQASCSTSSLVPTASAPDALHAGVHKMAIVVRSMSVRVPPCAGSSVRGFSRADMPKDPEKRFAALFGVRTRWDAADLAPYLLDMQGAPGASVEALLLKHTRASQPTPDGPITYTAR